MHTRTPPPHSRLTRRLTKLTKNITKIKKYKKSKLEGYKEEMIQTIQHQSQRIIAINKPFYIEIEIIYQLTTLFT